MVSAEHEDVERWLGRVCRQIEIPQIRLEYQSLVGVQDQRIVRMDAETHGVSGPRFAQSEVAWQTMIQAGTRPLGYLQVQMTEPLTSQKEFLRACSLADQISRMAVQYAGLLDSFQEVHQQQHQALTREALESGSVHELVEKTLKTLVRLTSYRGVAFFLLDSRGASLQLKHYLHQALQPVVSCQRDLLSADYDREALLSGQSVCRRRQMQDNPWLPEDVQTGLCVRVANHEGVLGTLWVFDRRVRAVEDRDLHVVQSVAVQLGNLLDQAIATLNSASHRRLKTELQLASITQPAKTIRFQTAADELSAYGRCLSQFDVGGDLCEVVPLGDDFVFVVVGDASGNSIPAAMVMTAVRGAVYALLSEIRDLVDAGESGAARNLNPAVFMQRLNRMLAGMVASHQFMSCICGLFHLKSREFHYCNAGHPSPIHLSGDEIHYLPSHGLLLGIDESVIYQQSQLHYEAGDAFVFYSDGISEAMGQSNRLFRQDGIAAAARSHLQGEAEEIVGGIWSRMQAHQAGNTESDDATLLVVKCS